MHELSYETGDIEDPSVSPDELDIGEHHAIAIAEERGLILLTDDLAARKAAIERGIEVHGSIGVIAFGFAQGNIGPFNRTDYLNQRCRFALRGEFFVGSLVSRINPD